MHKKRQEYPENPAKNQGLLLFQFQELRPQGTWRALLFEFTDVGPPVAHEKGCYHRRFFEGYF